MTLVFGCTTVGFFLTVLTGHLDSLLAGFVAGVALAVIYLLAAIATRLDELDSPD